MLLNCIYWYYYNINSYITITYISYNYMYYNNIYTKLYHTNNT